MTAAARTTATTRSRLEVSILAAAALPPPDPVLQGGATGNLASTVTITDKLYINSFIQPFTPGSTLSFTVLRTGLVDPGKTPDQFSFAILDKTGAELPTRSALD